MSPVRAVLVFAVLSAGFAGCGKDKTTPDPAPVEAPATEPAPPPAPEPAPAAAPATPQSLYDAARDRLEMPEADGECTADADCIVEGAGCSKEVCTTKKAGEGLMTACEVVPAKAAVDVCGCHTGKCTWTLKAELPAGVPGAAPMPMALPPTGAPPAAPAPAAPAPAAPAPGGQ